MASPMASPHTIASAGTTTNPPPAPTTPVKAPTRIPITAVRPKGALVEGALSCRRRSIMTPEHHDSREAGEEIFARKEMRDASASERANHGRRPERNAHAPPDPACARVHDHRREARRADDEEGGCDRRFGLEANHVDEDRYGEDRAATSKEPERYTDCNREDDGEEHR